MEEGKGEGNKKERPSIIYSIQEAVGAKPGFVFLFNSAAATHR